MSSSDQQHIPVLLQETIAGLALSENANVIDGTVGGGGHSRAILQTTAPHGMVLGIDRDGSVLQNTAQQLQHAFGDRFIPIHDSYAALQQLQYAAALERIRPIRAILLDLGLSSFQLDDQQRGFAYRFDAPLDMRFNTHKGSTAADILNSQPEEELRKIFREYGELNPAVARRLARAIVQDRSAQPFLRTGDLVPLVERVAGRGKRSLHPAVLVFQALRIAVNNELSQLEQFLQFALDLLEPHGRLAIISFHSLEDRLVKQQFKRWSTDCICPPELPECRCDHRARARLVTKKPIVPSEDEIERNQRSRSAKLRIIESIVSAE